MYGDGLNSDITHVVSLTDAERMLLREHFQWRGPARCSDATAAVIGYPDAATLMSDLDRLMALIDEGAAMTCLDWRRLLISTEILFGSDLLGCGVEWPTVTGLDDAETLHILRALQRKLAAVVRGQPSR